MINVVGCFEYVEVLYGLSMQKLDTFTIYLFTDYHLHRHYIGDFKNEVTKRPEPSLVLILLSEN